MGAPPTEVVNMTLTDAPTFSPRFLSALPNQSVSIHLSNNGTLPHSFTLASQSGLLVNTTWTPAELNQSLVTHPPIVNVSVPAGTSDLWANFTVAANTSFDSFLFVSQIPYQYQAGMWGYLNISSNSPGLLLSDNTTDSLAFQPSALAGAPAQFPANFEIAVTNLGTFAHTFTLSDQVNVTITTLGSFKTNLPLVNLTIPSVVGKSAYGNFTITTPGVYEYVCMQSGHFQDGMFGFFYAGVPVPAAPAPLSAAIVDEWVLAGSAALLGIGLLFVAIAGFSGRFPPRSPPPSNGGH